MLWQYLAEVDLLQGECDDEEFVPWGVRIPLNIDFESVVSRQFIGKISKQRNHNTQAPHEGQGSDQTEKADSAIWDEARRKCVFDSKSRAVKTDRKTPVKFATFRMKPV